MHILEIPSFFPPHGGLFCLEQAKALSESGHEVRIVSCSQLSLTKDKRDYFSYPLARKWIKMEGIDVYQSFMHSLPKLTRFNMQRWCHIVVNMFGEYIQNYGRPDLLHAHCGKFAGIAARIIKLRWGIPYVITEHISIGMLKSEFGESWTKHRWLFPMLRQAYEDAECVITVSDELYNDMKDFFDIHPNHVTISNTIDTDFFAYKERRNHSNVPYKFCCLAIGNIHGKGYDTLAEAWRGIKGGELHIAGNITDSHEMRDLFDGLDNVTIHGKLDRTRVRELLYNCDAMVLASRSEAQPLVILEAISSGTPVIATDVIPEVLHIEGACHVIPAGNSFALQQKMKEFIENQYKTDKKHSDYIKSIAARNTVAEQLENVFIGIIQKC